MKHRSNIKLFQKTRNKKQKTAKNLLSMKVKDLIMHSTTYL